jgi:hypothetical protein
VVPILQRVTVSNPAGSALAKTNSKNGNVALAGHDTLKGLVHIRAKLVAVAGKYRPQVRFFSSNPGDEVRNLLGLPVLGRSHERQLRPLPFFQAVVKALELMGDLVLPPADLHSGAGVSTKGPEANLGLLPLEVGKEEVLRNSYEPERGLADLRKYARITRNR